MTDDHHEAETRLRRALGRVADQEPVRADWEGLRRRVTDPSAGRNIITSTDEDGRPPRRTLLLAAAAVLAVVALAGGAVLLTRDGDRTEDLSTTPDEGAAGEPVRGGTLTYAIAADPATGYCLPGLEATGSMLLPVRAIYDTLTVPTEDGTYVPYLARTVTPNADHTQWDIELRSGITFHDGSPLDAAIVKDNLDAYRGTYVDDTGTAPGNPIIHLFQLDDVTSVEVLEPLTVRVTTDRPWVAFPAFLHSGGRLGIMARSQLDGGEDCERTLVGTGPFRLASWDPGTSLATERNPDYWQVAPDGEPYPYLDRLEFRVVPDEEVRLDAVAGGSADLLATEDAAVIAGALADRAADGDLAVASTDPTSRVTVLKLAKDGAPFDDRRMREALALAVDREDLARQIADGGLTLADGPIPAGVPGHLEEGLGGPDPGAARTLVDGYVADGGDPSFTLSVPESPIGRRVGELVAGRAEAAGMSVEVREQSSPELVQDLIAHAYDATLWTEYGFDDPDLVRVWWSGPANPLNFNGHDDPELDALLDSARGEADPATRTARFEDANRRLVADVRDVWLWTQPFAVATRTGVHGVPGPPLPGSDGTETDRRASRAHGTGHPVHGLWVEG